jgi:hypothetical protein
MCNEGVYQALLSLALYAKKLDPNLIISVGHPWRLQMRSFFQTSSQSPDLIKNCLYNSRDLPFIVQRLIVKGNVVAMTAKSNLYCTDRGYENRYFNEWNFRDVEQFSQISGINTSYGTIEISLPEGEKIPFGRPLVYFNYVSNYGYIHSTAICQEKWIATKHDGVHSDSRYYEKFNIIPTIAQYLGSKKGVLLEISNASPPSENKYLIHKDLNELASNYVDAVFDTDGLGTSGLTFTQFGHRLYAQNRKTIYYGASMSFKNVAVDVNSVYLNNAPETSLGKVHAKIIRKFQNEKIDQKANFISRTSSWDIENNHDRAKEERIRNIALWLFDFMRKTKTQGLAEAISGGQDSSFNSVMVRVMVAIAMSDLGVEGFCKSMSHLKYNHKILEAFQKGGKEKAEIECMRHMFTTVYLKTNNNSAESQFAAKTLIEGEELKNGKILEGIGGKYIEKDIQDILNCFGIIYSNQDSHRLTNEQRSEVFNDIAKFFNLSPL